jgi:LacI family transcriptional regulator
MRGESLTGPLPRRVGIRDVAQRAGVAISTVSKVFSGRGEVTPALRVRVLAAAADLGYQPNFIAQSLRRGSTNLIGFAASDLSEPFSAEIIAGAEDVLRPAGYALLVMSSNHDPNADAANVRYLNSRRVDAILVSPSGEDDHDLLAALGECDGPIVMLESELRAATPVDAVCADHRSGMREAVEHLVGHGHRRIAALTGPGRRRSGRERMAGLMEGLTAHGLGQLALPIPTDHRAEVAETEVFRALGEPNPPTAFIAGGLPLLIGALRAIHRRGVTIGRDLALVGWDDSPLTELSRPPIAVVDRDPHSLGAAAATLVLRRLRRETENEPPRSEVLPTRFIPRASSTFDLRRSRADNEPVSSESSGNG